MSCGLGQIVAWQNGILDHCVEKSEANRHWRRFEMFSSKRKVFFDIPLSFVRYEG